MPIVLVLGGWASLGEVNLQTMGNHLAYSGPLGLLCLSLLRLLGLNK